ncbi:hypothetical protein PH5382_01576 [Phaeobacter sp. CECT 5382]|uniref:DUF6446 family protein n=1 Tax=Phaeobacter sp. CECT 5382 TaxID=1712645 RepID=UPI0006D983B9|nr:DUF6446 family protein [Phaeobacter sp. CECT 5382]CUH87647.1 hypothetical protein PH5382_01576 [Phaeobacter sp. CECT 5382]
MLGKFLTIILLISGLAAGVAMYYFQVYGFYDEVTPRPGRDVVLTPLDGSAPQPIEYSEFRAIDADSSPIRYRACFTTTQSREELAQLYQQATQKHPRNAPGWFDCFDADALGEALADGSATAFVSVKDLIYGVDRIVAVTDKGQGFVWHEFNECGRKAYNGHAVGPNCPPRPEAN